MNTRTTHALARRRASNPRFRPACEGLEDRVVLSTAIGFHAVAAAPHFVVPTLPKTPAHPAPLKAAVAYKAPSFGFHVVATPKPTVKPIAVPKPTTTVAKPTTTVAKPTTTVAKPTTTATTSTTTTTTTATTTTPAGSTLITIDLKPLDVSLLGLEVKTNEITVTVSTQPGSGALLGNLLTTVSNLVNFQAVNNALNSVLGNVVTLANSASLSVSGVNSGPLSTTTTAATTPVLTAHVAPVHLNLLGAVVDTSSIDLSIIAHSGPGLVLGNVITNLANVLNTAPKKNQNLVQYVTAQLTTLNNQLNAQIPSIPAAPSPPHTVPAGTTNVLSLNVAPINLNLLGLVLKTDQIQVNADAQSGSGQLLGNLLTDLFNSLNATQADLSAMNGQVNDLLAKVVGVLNNATLTLPTGAVGGLSQTLQQLALPNLVNMTGQPATAPVLNLTIASTVPNTPPVNVNLLGLVVTTSDVHAQLIAQTGDGQVLGNLLYNVSHLLDPGGALGLVSILGALGL